MMDIDYTPYIAGFLLYATAFCSLENACYRMNDVGDRVLTLWPLFMEGFVAPIRVTYNVIRYDQIHFPSLVRMWCRLDNPWFAILITTLLWRLRPDWNEN